MVIRDLRLKNGWSQEKLAEMTNLSTRTIQRIEKEDNGSLESLNCIANAFEMDIKDLQKMLNSDDTIKSEVIISEKYQFLNDKKIFVFVAVNILLFTINMITNPTHIWFIYPLLGWGIPLFYKRVKKRLI